MTDRDMLAMTMAAEQRWLDNWVAGPNLEGDPVRRGQLAPDIELTAEDGSRVMLSTHWSAKPALVMLWRHLGCGCGIERIAKLKEEVDEYTAAGLDAVVVAPGEIERVIAYKERHNLPVPIMADPDYATHHAFGLSHWSKEQVLYDAPEEFCSISRDVGEQFQVSRRDGVYNLVDDPWMQSAEFVVDTTGVVRVAYLYNYCEDFPDKRIFTTGGRLAS